MSNVIQFASFKSRKDELDLYERNQARFDELKPRSFSQTLNSEEEIEFDELYNWLQIHNTDKNTTKVAY